MDALLVDVAADTRCEGVSPYGQDTLFEDMSDMYMYMHRCTGSEHPVSCHRSGEGLFPSFDKIGYDIKEVDKKTFFSACYSWMSDDICGTTARDRIISTLNALYKKEEHCLIKVGSKNHTWWIEILQDKQWRILSLWQTRYGFKDFAESPYGKFKSDGWSDLMSDFLIILTAPTSIDEVKKINEIYTKIFWFYYWSPEWERRLPFEYNPADMSFAFRTEFSISIFSITKKRCE